jgi:type I site-specific restriction endonuclease
MSVEKGFHQHRLKHRHDLLIYDRKGHPLMLVECKAPAVEINQQAFDQAGRYNVKHKAPYLLITNGRKNYCCQVQAGSGQYRFLKEIPDYADLV